MLRKFLQIVKRPGLLWLSRENVKAVRDRIIGLYLAQGEYYEAALPHGVFGIHRVVFTGGVSPCFVITVAEQESVFWLKVPKGHNPYWDFKPGEDREIMRLDFNAPLARIPATLICHWSKYFPFVPTDNYLQKGGDFVA